MYSPQVVYSPCEELEQIVNTKERIQTNLPLDIEQINLLKEKFELPHLRDDFERLKFKLAKRSPSSSWKNYMSPHSKVWWHFFHVTTKRKCISYHNWFHRPVWEFSSPTVSCVFAFFIILLASLLHQVSGFRTTYTSPSSISLTPWWTHG